MVKLTSKKMLNFDFTKSMFEFQEESISSYRDEIIKIINKLQTGADEYIFSAYLDSLQELQNIKRIANLIRKKFNTLIIVGIGGSSLGARTLIDGLRAEKGSGCRITFLENVDPDSVNSILAEIEPEKTAVNFISRSGTTLETVTHYLILKEYFRKKIKRYNDNFFITTADEESFLGREAKLHKFYLIKLPEKLVGRYSVLSPVGLLPASVAGININRILDGVNAIKRDCLNLDLINNPALRFAITLYHHYVNGKRNIVIMPYQDALKTFGEWFAQLWAESLGKVGADGIAYGQTPLRGIGTQDQHSLLQLYLDGPDDKIILFISGRRGDVKIKNPPQEFSYLKNKRLSTVLIAEQMATQDALFAKGRPSIGIHLGKTDGFSLGALIYFFEVVTLFMASFLKVNPFDQPAVEEIKKRAKAILST